MAGLGLALAAFAGLAIIGVVGPQGRGEVALVLVQFASLVAAGYVAGRLSPRSSTFDGGLAGLLVFVVVAAVSVAGGSSPEIAPQIFLGVVSAVLGSAGGVLAQLHKRPPP
jgi:hypothetical protein